MTNEEYTAIKETLKVAYEAIEVAEKVLKGDRGNIRALRFALDATPLTDSKEVKEALKVSYDVTEVAEEALNVDIGNLTALLVALDAATLPDPEEVQEAHRIAKAALKLSHDDTVKSKIKGKST